MPPIFPRHTIEWRVQETALLRRITLSLPLMAIATGVLVHLYRWFALSRRAGSLWLFLLLFAGGMVLLLALLTAHLANHTMRQWLWRTPLFALVESASEAAMSALLIALGVERVGTQHAAWADWPSLVVGILVKRSVAIVLFAVLLFVVVQWVRVEVMRRKHRDLVEGSEAR